MSKTKNKIVATKKAKPINILAAGLVLLIAVAGLLFLQNNGQASTGETLGALPREVSVADAASLREEGAFMLDVREPYEWNEIHIPGAVLVPLGELETRLDELPQDQPIVVVCRSGNRSAVARDILRAEGFKKVTSMAGGMNQWRAAGFDVESEQ